VIPYERLQEVLVESPRLASDLAEVIEIRQRAVAKALEGGLQWRGSAGTPTTRQTKSTRSVRTSPR
jgi:CRP-like cAMP-binding protein